jgi:hypothetical protein
MVGLLGPSDSLRSACQQVAKVVRGQSPIRPIRVLARPPVLFYLSIDGLPIERVESAEALYRPAGPRDWALHDSMIEPVAPRSRLADQWRIRRWLTQRVLWDESTPPTLLDLDPGAAFDPSGLAPTSTRLIISIYMHGQEVP